MDREVWKDVQPLVDFELPRLPPPTPLRSTRKLPQLSQESKFLTNVKTLIL